MAHRLRAFGLALLFAFGVIFALKAMTHDWLFAADGKIISRDFLSFWINGRFAVSAGAAAAYDQTVFAAAQTAVTETVPNGMPPFHLVYPPLIFPLVAPLGLLSYGVAFALWMGATAALHCFALTRIVPSWLIAVWGLATYAAEKNLFWGQTGFLLGGLLGLTLVLLGKRPFLGGLVLGVLTCKPQYGVLFPIVLLVSGQWRAIAGACVSALSLGGLVTLVYGTRIWTAYAGTFGTSSLDTFMTDPGVDAINQTPLGIPHWLHAGFAVQWAFHLIVAAAVTILVCAIWRRPVPPALKAGALGAGALLVTPYMLIYDLTAAMVPAAFLIQDGLTTGFRRGEQAALLGCFLLLFLGDFAPVGPVVLALLLGMIARRATCLPPAPV